jgi:hypothetical protein
LNVVCSDFNIGSAGADENGELRSPYSGDEEMKIPATSSSSSKIQDFQ